MTSRLTICRKNLLLYFAICFWTVKNERYDVLSAIYRDAFLQLREVWNNWRAIFEVSKLRYSFEIASVRTRII